MKKIVLLFFIFFAITARVDFAKVVVNRATEAVNLIGTEFPSVDKDALRDFFILNIGTSYGFKQ